MIKVLYDISLLGISFRQPTTFGLARTTENLLYTLLTIPELSLACSSDISFNVALCSQLYHSNYHQIPPIIQNHKQIKSVLTVHDLIPILYPQWCGIDEQKKVFNPEFNLPGTLQYITPETWIICPSHHTKNDLCNYLGNQIDHQKIKVIPWAASSLFYPCKNTSLIKAIKHKYRIPQGQYILSLNTLEPRKNIDSLIRAFRQIIFQEKIKDLYLVLAGTLGWQYESIFEEIRKNSLLASKIIMTGFVADQDLSPLYSGALGFVYPSFYEGFGLPPLEAMQCGTPVITSNVSSLPEVVGDAAILINPKDQNELSQALIRIYQSSFLRENLTRKSLQRCQEFSWDKCAKQTFSLYQEALN